MHYKILSTFIITYNYNFKPHTLTIKIQTIIIHSAYMETPLITYSVSKETTSKISHKNTTKTQTKPANNEIYPMSFWTLKT